ncbi:MAG: AAA family ATPase [Deltaproteobacteria bacterium]|nr:AAA family ATPase [Deltaproteobacteria bacterium]
MPAPTPGLHPGLSPRSGAPESERGVWTALSKHLPAGWWAWHSLRIRDHKNLLGEGDFVIADPRRGLLALEVKGGQLVLRGGHWWQNGRRMEKAPREQAERFVHRLVRRLEELGVEPPPFGAAVCFPDMTFDNEVGQDDLRGVVIGRRHLEWLDKALGELMEDALPPHAPRNDRWIRALHELWGDSWVPRLSLGARVEDVREQWHALDVHQMAVLEGLMANERMLVHGPAGSGKTLLAAETARRHAAKGMKTLLVCFTNSLRRFLDESLEGIEVKTLSDLAFDILRTVGHVPESAAETPATEAAFWAELPLKAAEAVELLHDEDRPDAIVVDEAQDLTESAWLLLSNLAEGRRMWAFADPDQAFWPDRRPPKTEFPFTFDLRAKLRCPPGISALADEYRQEAGTPDPTDDPEHAEVIGRALEEGILKIVGCPSASSVPEKVGRCIDQLLSEGLQPGDIFVVSLRGQTAEEGMAKAARIGRHEVVRADAPDMREKIVADTFLRVKGLERPAVIVTDLRLMDGASDADRRSRNARMHIALTRALVCARIVAPGEVLKGDEVLRRLL